MNSLQFRLENAKGVSNVDVIVYADKDLRNPIKRITVPVGEKYVLAPYRDEEAYVAEKKLQFTKWKTEHGDWDPHKGKERQSNECTFCDF